MDPFTLAAIAGIGSSVIGGLFGNSAADKQAEAAKQAQQIQQQQYQQSLDLLKPQIQTGDTARSYASGLLGLPGGVDRTTASNAFQTSPGYDFRLQQGTNAINQNAAAGGTLNSGKHELDLMRFGQGLGSEEFGNYYNRLMGLAGGGAGATGQAVQLGQGYGDNSSNIALGQGQQQASAYNNIGNNIMNTGQGLAGLYAKYGNRTSTPAINAAYSPGGLY